MAEAQEFVLPPLEQRPLVTFALFAYNQERFIREAIEGAFAQTYEPLEIILSDDCSTDRTFEIMEEMAASYRGEHNVRAIRNKENMGVTPHVFVRGKESNGEFVVVAAGDDISKPNRVSDLVYLFLNDDRVLGVTSAFDLIDEKGSIIARDCHVPIGVIGTKQVSSYFKAGLDEYVVIQGSTASYRRSVFDLDFPYFTPMPSEDNLLNFAIYANGGRVVSRSRSLILYRTHENALSNRPKKEVSLRDRERQSIVSAIKHINKMLVFQSIASHCKFPGLVDKSAIAESLRQSQIIVSWPEKTFFERLLILAREILIYRARFSKWQLARLVGTPLIYQPKDFFFRLYKRCI